MAAQSKGDRRDGGTIDIRALVSISWTMNSSSSASKSLGFGMLESGTGGVLRTLRVDFRFLDVLGFMGVDSTTAGVVCRRSHLARRLALFDIGGLPSTA